MRKIYSFSKFNALYEVETSSGELNVAETEASKLYDQTLGLILTTILNSYSSELSFTADTYDKNIDPDIISIKNSPVLNKPAEFVEILKKVQKSAAVDNNLEGSKEAVDAWVAAGTKATEALTAMVNQYKDQPEEINHINNFVNAKLDSFLEEIQIAADENDLVVDESSSYKGLIFEGILQGKKSLIGDVSRQITLVSAKLFSLAQTPGMSTEIQRLQNEVTQISAKMGDLLQKSNKDINKEDIKKAATRLAEIPGEADKIAEKMLKEDSINKEASSILIQALVLVQVAIKAEKIYLQKKEQAIQKETGDAANAAEKARAEKVKVKVEDYIEFDKDSVKKVNDEVKKVQQLIIDKFGDIEEIKKLPQYREFSRFGTDGKFGPRTQEMIKIIQKGLDMETSGNISPDFVYKVQTEDVVNESARSIFKFKEFNSLLESFKIKSAVEYAKKRPSFSSPSASSGSRSSVVKVALKEVVKEAEKSEFGKKSAEEKWNWLTTAYVVGSKLGAYKVESVSPDTYNGKKIIKIVFEGYKVSDFPVTTVCSYPEGTSLGEYKDYIYPAGKEVLVSEGKWGDKIETREGKSSSGNFIEIKEYPFDKKNVDLTKKVSSDAVIKEIARDIVEATSAAGTNPTLLVSGIKKIQSKEDLDAVNAVLKASYDNYKNGTGQKKYEKGREILGLGTKLEDKFISSDYSDLKSTVNSELESGNAEDLFSIVNHLKGKGINASYTPYIDKYTGKASPTSWITNTFSY